MLSTSLRRVLADVALALPLAAILSVVLLPMTRSVVGVGIALALAVGTQVFLHRAAVVVAKRLGSPVLPWSLWAAVTVCLWIIVAGAASVAAHIGNVEAGWDDSSLILPALLMGAVAVASAIAAVAVAGRIGFLLHRLRSTAPGSVAH